MESNNSNNGVTLLPAPASHTKTRPHRTKIIVERVFSLQHRHKMKYSWALSQTTTVTFFLFLAAETRGGGGGSVDWVEDADFLSMKEKTFRYVCEWLCAQPYYAYPCMNQLLESLLLLWLLFGTPANVLEQHGLRGAYVATFIWCDVRTDCKVDHLFEAQHRGRGTAGGTDI